VSIRAERQTLAIPKRRIEDLSLEGVVIFKKENGLPLPVD